VSATAIKQMLIDGARAHVEALLAAVSADMETLVRTLHKGKPLSHNKTHEKLTGSISLYTNLVSILSVPIQTIQTVDKSP
jgi:hypothetical protein